MLRAATGVVTLGRSRDTVRDETHAVREEYARAAADYDRRWLGYVAASVHGTLRRLALRPAERLLDVGCGTGALLDAVRRAHPGARAIGVDLAPEMLRVARRKLPDAVALVAADAARLPFGAESFDVVVSSSSFHYWPDPAASLRELRRVLWPGGRLAITDWCDDYVTCRVCDLVLRIADPAHRRAYGSGECVRLLRSAGFAEPHVEPYKINWFWGLMTATAARPMVRAGPPSP